MSLIFSCPACQEDLQDNYWDFWCATCEREISWLEFAEFDTDDERNEFLTYEDADQSEADSIGTWREEEARHG